GSYHYRQLLKETLLWNLNHSIQFAPGELKQSFFYLFQLPMHHSLEMIWFLYQTLASRFQNSPCPSKSWNYQQMLKRIGSLDSDNYYSGYQVVGWFPCSVQQYDQRY